MGMTIEGYDEDEIETGVQFMRSPVTENLYRVTKWVKHTDDHFVALEKERVFEVLVPHEESQGGRFHGRNCGGHILTAVVATRGELAEKDLSACGNCTRAGEIPEELTDL